MADEIRPSVIPAAIELTEELRDVLCECHAFLKSVDSTTQRVCFEWISSSFRHRDSRDIHPQRLAQPPRLGFLEKENATRGGARRHYRVVVQQSRGSTVAGTLHSVGSDGSAHMALGRPAPWD
jgi:hypothetical protein